MFSGTIPLTPFNLMSYVKQCPLIGGGYLGFLIDMKSEIFCKGPSEPNS